MKRMNIEGLTHNGIWIRLSSLEVEEDASQQALEESVNQMIHIIRSQTGNMTLGYGLESVCFNPSAFLATRCSVSE